MAIEPCQSCNYPWQGYHSLINIKLIFKESIFVQISKLIYKHSSIENKENTENVAYKEYKCWK